MAKERLSVSSSISIAEIPIVELFVGDLWSSRSEPPLVDPEPDASSEPGPRHHPLVESRRIVATLAMTAPPIASE